MGDNRVIYSRRSLWFPCLSIQFSNLLPVRSVFPESLVLLEFLLAVVTCQTHCPGPHIVRQHLNQTFGWQWTESGGAVNWPAPSSKFLEMGTRSNFGLFRYDKCLRGVTATRWKCMWGNSSKTEFFLKYYAISKKRSCDDTRGYQTEHK
jgi:hypothetical protein